MRSRLAWIAASAAALLGGGWFAWESSSIALKDRFVPRRFAVVEPGAIYRSGQLSPQLVRKTLTEHGIRVVIDLQSAEPTDAQRAEEEATRALGIEHLRFPLRGDGTGDVKVYAQAVAALARARGESKPVLVHCTSGSRRTAGVLADYDLLVARRPVADARREIDRYAGADGKTAALERFLDANGAAIASELVAMQVIAAAPESIPMLAAPATQ